ncbi:MAG: PQQ-binding-like beta-propeller repeat protein [Candidatus Bathyarchaeota archaeon]|nr:PQQ-binding-like beta-propeller repeat protein [Candidatus Bathyarchaeum sp.]
MKGSLAVGFIAIAILCLPIFSTFTLEMNAQQVSETGDQLATVSQLWNFTSNRSSVNSLVVSNGFVYVSSANSGSAAVTIYCLNASTGSETWNHEGLFGTFSVANGYVYVGEANRGNSNSLQGVVSCLNASDGAPVWNYCAGTCFSTPVVSRGIAYAGGFSYTLSTDVNIGFVYAFNASTGEKIWNFSGPVGTRFDDSALVLEDANLYALSAVYSSQDASWRSSIYAFNAYTGEELWNYTTPGQFCSLLAAGQNVYVSSNFVNTKGYTDAENSGGYVYKGGILALNSLNGALIWNHPINSSVGAPVIVDNTIYAVSGEGILYALNAANGKVIWNYVAGTGLGSLLSVNNYLYVGSTSGVYCFNADNGTVIWNFATSDLAASSPTFPAYADGIIYVGLNGPMFFSQVTQHNFYALHASSGEKLWNYTLGYTAGSSPVIENGTVYISGNFVTSENPDLEGSGAILALKSNVTSLPVSSPPVSETNRWPSYAITTVISSTPNSTWSTQTVFTDGSFGGIYMVLDSSNNPHISYSGVNGVLYYASGNELNWKIQSVIQGGTPISIVLDSQSNPHILYEGANEVVYYASWDGLNWNFQVVPEGYGYSVALDSADNPHLAYATVLPVSDYPQGVTNDISMLNYASWNGSNWSIQTVDSPISYTDSIYLALDQHDNPYIMYGYDTYYPPSGGNLLAVKFAVWEGSTWNIQTALSNLDYFGNMVLDCNGYPHFIYAVNYPHSSSNNATMGYASWDGSAWNTQTVVSNAALGLFIEANLALDTNSYPHIEFFNGSLMHTSWTGSEWNIQTVAPNNFAYGKGPLALDSNDNPHICYWVTNIHNTTAFVSSLLYTMQAPTDVPAVFDTLFIIIGIVAVGIVAGGAFLLFKKRSKVRAQFPN